MIDLSMTDISVALPDAVCTCFLSTIMTSADMSPELLLQRTLRVASMLRARDVTIDHCQIDFGPIRQKTLGDRTERFSYVDFGRTETVASRSGNWGRRVWCWYRPWIAGQLVRIEHRTAEYPLFDSVGFSLDSNNAATLRFFAAQPWTLHCSPS